MYADQHLTSIYLALHEFDEVRLAHGASKVKALLSLARSCIRWRQANPQGWVAGRLGGAARSPEEVRAVRAVVTELEESVQQELLDIATSGLPTLGTVFYERPGVQRTRQTPPQATRPGMARPGGGQTHWEGWKLHVSVPPSRAGLVALELVPMLEKMACAYKVRRNVTEYRKVTDASKGKFLVIYPRSIEHLEQLLSILEALLPRLVDSEPTVPVAGDVKLDAHGYVWARYGVFLDTAKSSNRHVRLNGGRTAKSEMTVWDSEVGGWVDDPRDAEIPAAWASKLRARIQAIRDLAEIEHAAAQERSRPRARTV